MTALADLAPPAEEARAADDRRGDRVEEQRAAADVEVDGVQSRGQDHASDPGHRAGDQEDDDANAGDVDAGATSRFGIAADGVDVAAERCSLRQVGQPDQEDDDKDAGERQRLCGTCAWLEIATTPKQATASARRPSRP